MDISKLLQRITYPISNEAKFFIIAYFWGVFSIIMNWHPYLPNNIKLFGELFIDTFIISALIYWLPNPFKTILRTALYVLIFTTTIIETFCYVRLETLISTQIIQLCLETEPREISEFLSTYIDYSFLYSSYSISLLIIIFATSFIIYHRFNLCNRLTRHRTIMGGGIFLLFVLGLFCAKDNKRRVLKLLNAQTAFELSKIQSQDWIADRAFYLPFYRLIFSFHSNRIINNQVYQQIKLSGHISIDSCNYTSPTIVLIIGESYNKHHSQLYGYSLPTTPFQINEMKKGSLFVFKDAVTNYNLTSQAFKNMLSLNDISQGEEWSDKPLVTQIFRKAEYKTYFISNQFIVNDSRDPSAGAFINNKELSLSQFDYRNDHLHTFDFDLVNCYDSLNNHDPYKFIIFHLIGQHVDYQKRYPSAFRRMKTTMYSPNDLSAKELEIVCDYDNATAYNDYVISKIINHFKKEESIILYLSDHGEECYDEIKRFGRSNTTNISPNIAKNEFEIPFWIWMSPKYMKNHPDMENSIIHSLHKPFYNGDLGHLLLSLGGVACKYYRKNNNILSPNYKKHKRIINEIADYDQIIQGAY